MTDIIFYDTEFTAWEGSRERDWTGPGEARELVQIGAIRFDLGTLEEKEEFLILVKPVKNPLLSGYFTQLTGITNAELEKDGVSFTAAYKRFRAFMGKTGTACFGGDAKVMRENLGWNNMPATETEFDSFNICPWFKETGAPYGIKGNVNSGKLAALLGAPMKSIQEHNALHDARSIAAAYRFLVNKGVQSPFGGLKAANAR
jgi:inhibitor of KinA sporulation pathway (predicted exonuclease)